MENCSLLLDYIHLLSRFHRHLADPLHLSSQFLSDPLFSASGILISSEARSARGHIFAKVLSALVTQDSIRVFALGRPFSSLFLDVSSNGSRWRL